MYSGSEGLSPAGGDGPWLGNEKVLGVMSWALYKQALGACRACWLCWSGSVWDGEFVLCPPGKWRTFCSLHAWETRVAHSGTWAQAPYSCSSSCCWLSHGLPVEPGRRGDVSGWGWEAVVHSWLPLCMWLRQSGFGVGMGVWTFCLTYFCSQF